MTNVDDSHTTGSVATLATFDIRPFLGKNAVWPVAAFDPTLEEQ